jgi:hypothetical protein
MRGTRDLLTTGEPERGQSLRSMVGGIYGAAEAPCAAKMSPTAHAADVGGVVEGGELPCQCAAEGFASAAGLRDPTEERKSHRGTPRCDEFQGPDVRG